MSEGNSRSAPPVSVQTINVNVTFGAAASAIVSVGETLTSVSTKPHAAFGISMLSSTRALLLLPYLMVGLHAQSANDGNHNTSSASPSMPAVPLVCRDRHGGSSIG